MRDEFKSKRFAAVYAYVVPKKRYAIQKICLLDLQVCVQKFDQLQVCVSSQHSVCRIFQDTSCFEVQWIFQFS